MDTTTPRTTLHRQFCRNVRQRRQELGLTQADLAARLGRTRAYVAQVEGARFCSTLDLVERWANALHIEPVDLLADRKKTLPS